MNNFQQTWTGIWNQFQEYLQPSSNNDRSTLHPIHLTRQSNQTTSQYDEQPIDLTPSQEIKDLKKLLETQKTPKIKYLALSGGGVKGFAYIGCFQALKDLNLLELEEISGTSIGSVFGFFHILKYTPEELYSFVKKFEYNMIKSLDFLNIFRNWGIETGEKSVRFLQSMIRYKLQKTDLTFEELYEINPIKFTVVATHLNTRQAINYNHINTPQQSVVQAIRQSISIPGMFTPITQEIDNNNNNNNCQECQLDPTNQCDTCKKNLDYYVDGALMNNFPIDQVMDSENTLGFCFISDKVKYTNITCFENYVQQIFLTCFHHNTIHKIMKYKDHPSHIIVLDNDTSTLNLNFDYQTKRKLWKDGYDKVASYYTEHAEKNSSPSNPDLSEDQS